MMIIRISIIIPTFAVFTFFILNYCRDLCNASNAWMSHQMDKKPSIMESETKHTATIIFIHGVGVKPDRWLQALGKIRQPFMKVICPTANKIPITWCSNESWPSWFDFGGNKYADLYDLPYTVSDMEKSIEYLHHVIQEEIDYGIKPNRIIIGGFSQGALMALHVALSFNQRLAGIMAIGPWHPHEELLLDTFNPVNKDIPILECHIIRAEPFIEEFSGNKTAQFLKNHISKNVDWKAYTSKSGVQMTSQEEFDEMTKFCKKHVSVQ